MRSERWTLTLAGGAGRRLASLTGGLPKQFWSVSGGGRSLIEETARRTAAFAPAGRRVTVVDRSHRVFVEALRTPKALGHVLYQPEDRGTAAGVLLGLTEILARDAGAVVLLTPADHGVVRTDLFHAGLQRGLAHVSGQAGRIVLFGIESTSPDGEYGWVAPEPMRRAPVGRCVAVREFVEKPPAPDVARLYHQGAVWNTMVLIARAQTLWEAFWRCLPDLVIPFAEARRQPAPARQALLDAEYAQLPSADFSRDLIEKTAGLDLYTWPIAMGWSDLGTPDRVFQWHAQRDRRCRMTVPA